MKRLMFLVVFIGGFIFMYAAGGTDYKGIYVKGNKIFAPDGQELIFRGINKMFVWTDKEGNDLEEIAKTGANIVRIVWTIKDGTPEGLEKLVEKCAQNGMLPMVEVHDQTCKWEDNTFKQITGYWTSPELVKMVKKHENYLLINYGNEIGTWQTSIDEYNEKYSAAVKEMRKAGIRVPVVIDAGRCGQDINSYYSSAEAILKNDPLHNVILSVHMWWIDNDPARIQDALSATEYVNAPLIVGEFAAMGIGCTNSIAYKTIIEECHKKNIGWLAWSWGPGNSDCAQMDMTKDGKYKTLYGWGKEVAVNSKYSIKKTSKKAAYLKKALQERK